jgi:hypothetical protein
MAVPHLYRTITELEDLSTCPHDTNSTSAFNGLHLADAANVESWYRDVQDIPLVSPRVQ